MNRSEFITKLEQHGISLDDSRMHEVNYYYNLWQDTMKQDLKMRHPHDFDAFVTWLRKQ